ncbi:hypothetical protein [Nitrosarchaeum sp. AC2]|uniref:hypothetical protein n=1 Tax=Nitrosarchaeum sp. AC2 TaxID=2259673 RepID=UPI0015C8CFC1|nr:hypothetical protein [Nitrosarchaeum sp. AC2]QLH11482.1 hypothetical protein DSQ20_08550 [Nitrosarchaeum sp. AC2]
MLKKGKTLRIYGLNISDFSKKPENEKSPKLSRDIFYDYSKELLNSKLIIEIDVKNKRGKCYSITPLGIVYLLQTHSNYFNTISMTEFKRIELILNYFIMRSTTRTKLFKFEKEIIKDVFVLLSHLMNLSKDIQMFLPKIVDYSDDFTRINLSIPINNVTNFNITNLVKQGDTYAIGENTLKDSMLYADELSDNEFHSYFANFLICALSYSVIYKFYLKYMKKNNIEINKITINNIHILQRIKQFNDYLISQSEILDNNLKSFDNMISKKL